MKILVFVKIEIVKRVPVSWVAITKSKVDGYAKLNLTPSEDVLEESVPLVEDKILKASALLTTTSHQLELKLAFPQLGNVATDVAEVDVFATLL